MAEGETKREKNSTKEQELLETFKTILLREGVDEDVIRMSPGNKSKIMDFNFKIKSTGTLMSLEAKTFNDTRTNSNFFLSLFGKILKGRYLNSVDSEYKNELDVQYGFLFDSKDKEKIMKLLSVIKKEDWKVFCERFEVRKIYLVDKDCYKVCDAATFINSATKDSEYFKDKSIVEEDESQNE